MMTTNLNDLLEVLEKIRSERYPDVPPELVKHIAMSQYENQDNRGKARTDTKKIIAEYMNEIKGV